MLKRILLLCTIIASISARAQFTIDDDTLYAYGYVASSSSGFADVYGHTIVRHTGMGSETIKWVRTDNTLPDAEWTSAVCDIISCRGPEVDTGSFQIGNQDTGNLSFHFYPKNIRGNGSMKVKFYRADNPLEFVEVVIMCQAWQATSVNSTSALSLHVYPNPVKDQLFVQSDISVAKLEITDATGRLVLTDNWLNNGQSVDISALVSGIYTIRLIGDNQVYVQNFVKE
mgnify:CR=1 FL=1